MTIPFENTFNPEINRQRAKSEKKDKAIFCGCGWPHHMLVPKGDEDGVEFVLFVMVSDYMKDQVGSYLPLFSSFTTIF